MAQQDSADAQMARNLPAPKTFAPSRDDVLSTLAFFFGDPAVPEKLKDYSEHHAMTYHFPDAFYGQNVSTCAAELHGNASRTPLSYTPSRLRVYRPRSVRRSTTSSSSRRRTGRRAWRCRSVCTLPIHFKQ